MNTLFEKITKDIYAILLWDDTWDSYNNCYVIKDADKVTLIDSGKAEHFSFLEKCLNNIDVRNEMVTQFIATHGHKDHVGGCQHFINAPKYIHPKDLDLLNEEMRPLFKNLLDKDKVSNDIESVILGHHTDGSVAFFHQQSGVLFCGDHLCFFGEPLPNNELIVDTKLVQDKVKKYVSDWLKSEEMREKYNFDLFIDGLKSMSTFNAKFLCTGHGVILRGDIPTFLNELLEVGVA